MLISGVGALLFLVADFIGYTAHVGNKQSPRVTPAEERYYLSRAGACHRGALLSGVVRVQPAPTQPQVPVGDRLRCSAGPLPH